MLWLVVAYLGSLAALFVTAFWSTDTFTGALDRTFTLDNFREILTTPVYCSLTLQTLGVATVVTLISAAVALPLGFFMAKVASRRMRGFLLVAILTPLWASLPREGLRVARRCSARTACSTGCSSRSACPARASGSRR